MNSLNFLDTNVWMGLLWERHRHSDKARFWFAENAQEKFLFCRFTQMAVLRLLTTERIMESDVRTMAGAWQLWDQVSLDPRIEMLPEPEGLEEEFRLLSRLPSPSPKVWADAYLLAFARAAGLKFVTFDKALERRGADVLVL
jgi:hypothetical protein